MVKMTMVASRLSCNLHDKTFCGMLSTGMLQSPVFRAELVGRFYALQVQYVACSWILYLGTFQAQDI
jgi:hypothetical protein